MLTPEGRVKKKIDAYLTSIGVRFIMKPATFGYGASGAPDRVCSIKGRMLAIEVKREGKTPTALQRLRMKELHADGAVAIWGDSAESIIEQIKAQFGLD
jgi:hypothetical protein